MDDSFTHSQNILIQHLVKQRYGFGVTVEHGMELLARDLLRHKEDTNDSSRID